MRFCLQELLSQDGFPSEKVTNLEKSHFMSAVLRCASPVCSVRMRSLLFVGLLYACGALPAGRCTTSGSYGTELVNSLCTVEVIMEFCPNLPYNYILLYKTYLATLNVWVVCCRTDVSEFPPPRNCICIVLT